MFKLFNMSFVGRPVQPVFIKLYCIHSSFCHGEWVGAPTVWIYIIHFVLIVEKVNWIMELLQPSRSCCIICIEVIGTSVYDIDSVGFAYIYPTMLKSINHYQRMSFPHVWMWNTVRARDTGQLCECMLNHRVGPTCSALNWRHMAFHLRGNRSAQRGPSQTRRC